MRGADPAQSRRAGEERPSENPEIASVLKPAQSADLQFQWRTSSASASGECVEVGGNGELVAVRDSKDRSGPALAFTVSAWREFTAAMRTDA